MLDDAALDTSFRAARTVVLDAGPVSGFDNATVDAEFLSALGWRSSFLVNLGHGDPSGLHPRAPWFESGEACRLL